MASFENLVALANYQERLKDARKIVWRDRGQPVVELPTLKDCVEHAGTGAFSALSPLFFTLSFLTPGRISDSCIQHPCLFELGFGPHTNTQGP
jgi:hypothetical protein